MNPLVSGAIAGFILGLIGFIIVQFWIRPILGYRKIKGRIASNLRRLEKNVQQDGAGNLLSDEMKTSCRTLSAALSKSYSETLPGWYKIALGNRREDPMEACGHLMTLSNIREPGHAEKRAAKLKKSLGLT